MDYLDPNKELRHRIVLLSGYVLVAVAIVIATLVLVYQAYGFGLGKDGQVTQNGLTFFSSQPNPAKIYTNGTLQEVTTNTRLVLPAGLYDVKLTREGYHDWQGAIELDGGSVKHFDYPLLLPKKIVTKKIQTYDSAPSFMTQSRDRRWLLIQQPGSMITFDIYDLKNPDKTTITTLSLPGNLLSKAVTAEAWQLVEWADDDQHVLLRHDYDAKTEFVLVDRAAPEQSLNLNKTLALNPTKITLNDKKYDRYYVYDGAAVSLQSATLENPAPATVLSRVLAYQSYGDDTLLYATDSGASAGKTLVKLKTGSRTSLIRTLPADKAYLLDLTKYDGTMYVAVGGASQTKIYIYRDPVGQLNARPGQAIVPAQVLHVDQPNYLSFSSNAQFIVAENASRFGVYDNENKIGHNYTVPQTPDQPQQHASWMDGNRLTYVSGGKLIIADYDSNNMQSLMPASSSYLPAFAPNYKDVYVLVSNGTPGQFSLTQTSLLTPGDR